MDSKELQKSQNEPVDHVYVKKIIGPPGTGKTATIVGHPDLELEGMATIESSATGTVTKEIDPFSGTATVETGATGSIRSGIFFAGTSTIRTATTGSRYALAFDDAHDQYVSVDTDPIEYDANQSFTVSVWTYCAEEMNADWGAFEDRFPTFDPPEDGVEDETDTPEHDGQEEIGLAD